MEAQKYHADIIKDPTLYDALEINGVSETKSSDGETYCEPIFEPDVKPDFFSVYAHLIDGGVECIGDLPTAAQAHAYAGEVSALYGWTIHDHIAGTAN